MKVRKPWVLEYQVGGEGRLMALPTFIAVPWLIMGQDGDFDFQTVISFYIHTQTWTEAQE